jgi:hypothetical protein
LAEKCCFVCGHNGHYTKDCPNSNHPKVQFNVLANGVKIGEVSGRVEYEAFNEACRTKPTEINWKTIKVERVVDAKG